MVTSIRVGVAAAVAGLALAVSAAGVPVGQTLPSSEPTLSGEWMIAPGAGDAFRAARETVRALGFGLEREDATAGLLVTRQAPYRPDWPSAEALGLPATHAPESAILHLRVAPGFDPPRIAVGAVLVTATVFVPYRLPLARGHSTIYGHSQLAAFVATRIGERLGRPLDPVAADPEARARQAARLAGSRAPTCGPAVLLTGDDPQLQPRLVHAVRPQYPTTNLYRRVGGAVRLRGEMTEHGTLTGIAWAGGVEDPTLVAAATGAAGLWRFTAPVASGCPGRRTITLEMSFSITR